MTRPLHTLSPERQARQRASTKRYNQLNAEKIRVREGARHKLKYATIPEYRARKDWLASESRLRTKYGLTWADKAALLAGQGGVCAICQSPSPRGLNWHIDHNHKTGKVRAILCGPCNVYLGRIESDPELLKKIFRYIRLHK